MDQNQNFKIPEQSSLRGRSGGDATLHNSKRDTRTDDKSLSPSAGLLGPPGQTQVVLSRAFGICLEFPFYRVGQNAVCNIPSVVEDDAPGVVSPGMHIAKRE